MREPREYRLVGGPMNGELVAASADVIVLQEHSGMAYHRTRPTDTNWRAEYDPEWFIKGVPEPKPPDHVYEWHEREWRSPEVTMIRDAVREAAARR